MAQLGTLERSCKQTYLKVKSAFTGDVTIDAIVFGPVPQSYQGTVVCLNHTNHTSDYMSDDTSLDVHTYVISVYNRDYVTAASKCDLAFQAFQASQSTAVAGAITYTDIYFTESQGIEHVDEDGYVADLIIEHHVRQSPT